MRHLFAVINPRNFRLSLTDIARFLGIPQKLILRFETWGFILFVHRSDRGGQFVSYRQLIFWIEACAQAIRSCADLKTLNWLGQVIKAECDRFVYPAVVVDYWRQIWLRRRREISP
jgi:hypothetical protein